MGKLHTVKMYPACPNCGSFRTGLIKPRTMNARLETKFMLRNLNREIYVKYVDERQYAEYYKQYQINLYCNDCDYEFRGTPEYIEMDDDEKEEYKKDMGFEDALKAAESSHKCGKLRKAMQTLFPSFSFYKGDNM